MGMDTTRSKRRVSDPSQVDATGVPTVHLKYRSLPTDSGDRKDIRSEHHHEALMTVSPMAAWFSVLPLSFEDCSL